MSEALTTIAGIASDAAGSPGIYDFVGMAALLASILFFSHFIRLDNVLYPVMLIATGMLIWSCSYDKNADEIYGVPVDLWAPTAIPIYVIIVVALVFLLRLHCRPGIGSADKRLDLSCVLGISSALIVFILFARATREANVLFFTNWLACIVQMAVFIGIHILAGAPGLQDSSALEKRSLFATVFLAAAASSAYLSGYGDKSMATAADAVLASQQHYFLVSYGFYGLWIISIGHGLPDLWKFISSRRSLKNF